MSIRLLLVDDNQLFRKALAALLANDSDFLVVHESDFRVDVTQRALDQAPDLVLMDMQREGPHGLDMAAEIRRRLPDVRIVLLTAQRSEERVRAALRLGVDGYVLKDATTEELKTCLRAVASGRKYLSPEVSVLVVDSLMRPDGARARDTRLSALTPRERLVLQVIAEGRTNRAAAEHLNISPKTIEKHRSNLMHKLGLRNAAELTLAALELGLIERPSAVARLSPAGERG
ncbi:MAG: response regulator [Burkholderiaceae bacterium]